MARIRKAPADSDGEKERVWYIAVYIRLSKDDGNDESLSVTNQKKIIREYLEHSFEGGYEISDFYIDDGLTGTDYERPAFQRMLHDVEAGKVNCVICKNLSRAFRNYSDQGYFLENYFPLHKTRFITISDPKVDSFLRPETIQNLEVPITGLMNDRYACKTSNDVRDTFNTKRRSGEFIGAFAPYGYLKDSNDKNRLVIDAEAADIVRSIFKWFTLDGFSKNGIARRLNAMGVPNPTEYKRRCGLSYSNPHASTNDGLWSACTVSRILQSKTYLGHMVQGRQRVISYKVHNLIAVPEEEWFIKENTHEAIVTKELYDKAQLLQERDTKTAPKRNELYLFSGLLRCGDCGKALTRKVSKGIVYYSCRTYSEKSKSSCSKHSIREDVLKRAVLTVLQKQISLVVIPSEITDEKVCTPMVHTQSSRLNHLLRNQTAELQKLDKVLESLYPDWKNGDITRDEYLSMKAKYESQTILISQAIQNIRNEIATAESETSTDEPYYLNFLKNQNITELNRSILVELVDTIYVYKDEEIKIEFNFADQHKRIAELIEKADRSLP